MNNYNDFPILNEEQYLKLSEQYNLKLPNKSNLIQQVFNHINFAIKSLIDINTNYNNQISEKMNKSINNMKDIFSSLQFLYPTIKPNNNEQSNNIFIAISHISGCIISIQNLLDKEDKKYYKTALMRLQNKLIVTLNEILLVLSKLSFRTFKHF